MAQKMKLTTSAIPVIQSWIEQGLSAEQIAENIGCTVGSLRVRCSHLGISLRRRGLANGAHCMNASVRQSSRSLPMLVSVPETTAHLLQCQAALKGTTESKLVASLLDKITQDNLYDAILDED